jgi:hypothetical protein
MDSYASRVLDNMDIDGFVRTLSKFGQICDSGRENEFIIGSESGLETKEHYHNE